MDNYEVDYKWKRVVYAKNVSFMHRKLKCEAEYVKILKEISGGNYYDRGIERIIKKD